MSSSARRPPEDVVAEVFSLLKEMGEAGYIGEAVSQLQHALQSGHLAELEGYPTHVILGALFHDVGHLVGDHQGLPSLKMGEVVLGTQNHEIVGEEYLRNLGFPDEVTKFVRGHVDAKRYLVAINPQYYQELSEPSKMTLKHQGGPMTPEEVEAFKADPQHEAILRMRSWDEQAKDVNAKTPTLQHFRSMCLEYLKAVGGA